MRYLSGLAVLALAGCASLPPGIADSECRQRFESLEARIDDAGVRDGGEARIEGFPYLRVNRFLASFRDEVDAGAAFDAWVQRLRDHDRQARRAELRNLGLADADEVASALDRCGEQLMRDELAGADAQALLRKRAQVPDDYSVTARILGAYALAAPFLKSGVSNYQEEVQAQYRTTWTGYVEQIWSPAVVRRNPTWNPQRDALGIPQFTDEQWTALAAANAPDWWVEKSPNYGPASYDRPGTPVLSNGQAAFDGSRPVVHFLPSYTRFGTRVLAQLNYVIWFAERPFQSDYDPYAGLLDGVIWRVTLDENGRPLVYDTIHACGCYHYYFPVQPLQPRESIGYWQETALVPQSQVPDGRVAVVLQSATHYVTRVKPSMQTVGANPYELRPYSELLSLETGDGRRRSLFAEDGLIEGTERGESQWLWMTGIASAGAMRQWGRHATAFVGRAHFDDARALEAVFTP